MQLDFFPSATLTKYLAKTFIVRILAVLVMLVLVLMMLDLLSNSGKILAVPGNGQGELLTYAGLRIPQLIQRFLPYSVLLATLITLVTLNQNSEVIAMKAAGLSAHQVLAPLLLTALILWMYYRVAFVPGGQAIGALESWFAKVSQRVTKLFRRRRRVVTPEGAG